MRRLITYFFFLLCINQVNAQSGQCMITLKNGTLITGVVKSIDPVGDVVISLAGELVNLKMTEVAKIEEKTENEITISPSNVLELNSEKLVVTDHADYPETFDLKIGDETFKMILVRGGDLNMGYDGNGSMSMNSEPVHRVGVTSFYMSDTFVPRSIIYEETDNSKKKEYYYAEWEEAAEIVNKIADVVGLPVRLPLEAEWEYAACSNKQDVIFDKCNKLELCSDLYQEEFQNIEYKIDPTGPKKGKYGMHVIRAYNQRKGKLRRMGTSYYYNFRLVIKAKDIK